ncbi:MAG: sigma-54-dependent Fis family transcriptional regulator [Candidatus Rokubacteria bacterium]|nr:sigma-54-dependent Fis family transcriptional regulator [Candidatus Rokubacteria bacterium]
MAPSARILVVDDDPDLRETLSDRLEALGFQVTVAGSGPEALRLLREEPPAIVLLDLVLPGMDGMVVLGAIRREEPDVVVIVLTAHGTIARAVEAMKNGAYDFVTKPFDPKHLEIVLGKALERQALQDANAVLTSEVADRYAAIVGDSPAMQAVLEVARRAAPSGATVLLLGESGTGKEVLARAIHRWSLRASRPFVVVNCVALSEELLESELFGHEKGAFTGAHQQKRGKLEVAHGGTVFLDEIGDVRPALQAKLLRVLQDQTFERVGGTRPIRSDLRFIAATNRDLPLAVRQEQFRLDLFYRLNVVAVTLPPLRERPGDIDALAHYFLERYRREIKREIVGLSPDALACLRRYPWPGNVRELENAIERAVVLAEGVEIAVRDLPVEVRDAGAEGGVVREGSRSFHAQIEEFKRGLILSTLRRTGGNRTQAARILGLQRTYLAKLIRELGLPPSSAGSTAATAPAGPLCAGSE